MKLSEVRTNYDRAAKYYDALTDLVCDWILGLEKYREQTIDTLAELRGATVVDVGCGTGRSFSLLVSRVGQGGRIIGADYSAGMLEQARKRVRDQGWQNVELVCTDAAKLEGVPENVDAVISIWCYGIVDDLDAALRRAIELLRPGGRMAIMDFTKSIVDSGFLRWLYPIYSFALRHTGIDTAEDLDNAKLQAKWERGRDVMRAELIDLREKTYLRGTGIILSGRKPEGGARAEGGSFDDAQGGNA